MKKIISIAMVVLCLSLIVVLFTACGGDKDDATTTNPTSEGQVSTDVVSTTEDSTADASDASTTTKADAKPSGSSSKPSGSSGSSSQGTKPPKTTVASTKPVSSNNSGEGVQLAPGSIYDDWY